MGYMTLYVLCNSNTDLLIIYFKFYRFLILKNQNDLNVCVAMFTKMSSGLRRHGAEILIYRVMYRSKAEYNIVYLKHGLT